MKHRGRDEGADIIYRERDVIESSEEERDPEIEREREREIYR